MQWIRKPKLGRLKDTLKKSDIELDNEIQAIRNALLVALMYYYSLLVRLPFALLLEPRHDRHLAGGVASR